MFHAGILPAVNPGISVSRVGGSAQLKAMKRVAGTLKLLYSQYRELQSFAQFGSDLDADTRARLAQGERIVEILKQDKNSPMQVGCQVALIHAAISGKLADVAVEDIRDYERELVLMLESEHFELLHAIADGKWGEGEQTELDRAVTDFTEKFKKAHA
jgi:F-type H+-transporting ATPase subunit alpha